jgi:hypothetical protein
MKTLEQLAKEFVCNVGREPTEKQEMEIKALVMFGKAVIKECQLTPVMKPTLDQGAMKIAKAEYVYWVFSGNPTPHAPDSGEAAPNRGASE